MIILLYDYILTSLYHYIIILVYHYIIISLYHYIIISLLLLLVLYSYPGSEVASQAPHQPEPKQASKQASKQQAGRTSDAELPDAASDAAWSCVRTLACSTQWVSNSHPPSTVRCFWLTHNSRRIIVARGEVKVAPYSTTHSSSALLP